MKKFYNSFRSLLIPFLSWRISLFIVAFIASLLISFHPSFPYFDKELIPTGLPSWVWGFGNFDGVHYIRIAKYGYTASQYSEAFFPLYPLLIRAITLGSDFYLIAGLILSNLFFLLAITLLNKLFLLDFDSKRSFRSVLLLLAFPTAFYFGALYTESLFLLLTVLSIYLFRKGKLLEGGIISLLASATRIIGVLLSLVVLIELIVSVKGGKIRVKSLEFVKGLLGIIAAPLGTIFYMVYLKINFNNPLYFLTSQPIFGAQRSSDHIVLLPQVLFRYLKIIFSVPFNSYPFFNAVLEFSFTIGALALLIIFIKKIRFSYLVFMLSAILLPTLTGTLSSMPRYSLMIFLTLPFLAQKYFKVSLILFITLQVVLVALFLRGYWIA